MLATRGGEVRVYDTAADQRDAAVRFVERELPALSRRAGPIAEQAQDRSHAHAQDPRRAGRAGAGRRAASVKPRGLVLSASWLRPLRPIARAA
jgi:hypothetical protein